MLLKFNTETYFIRLTIFTIYIMFAYEVTICAVLLESEEEKKEIVKITVKICIGTHGIDGGTCVILMADFVLHFVYVNVLCECVLMSTMCQRNCRIFSSEDDNNNTLTSNE